MSAIAATPVRTEKCAFTEWSPKMAMFNSSLDLRDKFAKNVLSFISIVDFIRVNVGSRHVASKWMIKNKNLP